MGRQHLLYLWQLEIAGRIFGAGPLEHGDPKVEPTGMLIFAASSREAAQRMAEEEPYDKAGWRQNTIKEWKLNEGASAFMGLLLSRLAGHPIYCEVRADRVTPEGRPPVRLA